MNQRVNLQARIKRHSRILKENLWNSLHHSSHKSGWFRLVAIFIVLLFPVYPAFATLVYSNTELDFYRWDIDETSILSSYKEQQIDDEDESTIYDTKDSYLSVWVLVDDNLSSSNKIIEYDVQEWDTIRLLAKQYEISYDTIMWANNFWKDHLVEAWDKIIFPPVSGIIYTVESGNSISQIAKKYSIESDAIIEQNSLTSQHLKIGQKLILPWAEYIEPPKIVEPVAKAYVAPTKKTSTNTAYNQAAVSTSSYTANKGRYVLTQKPSYHTFYWGNCTWFVAKYKSVNWGWNANQWLYNARAKWHATGYNASLWSIIVFGWRWYNPRYGHVWIVMEVYANELIIADMNYRRLGEVTYRKINRWDSWIKWYIYVD